MSRVELIGWCLVMGIIPFGAGLYAINSAHVIIGTVLIAYGAMVSVTGIILSRNT